MVGVTGTLAVLALAALMVVFAFARSAVVEARDESSGARARRGGGTVTRLLDSLVTRAGWRVTSSELGLGWGVALAASAAWAVASTSVPLLRFGPLVVAVLAVPLAAWFSGRRASRSFERQFGAAMPLIAADIKSGGTVMGALRSASEVADEPLRGQLMRCVARVDGGMSPEESISEMARSARSVDAQILATAVAVQQNHGGSVVGVIDQIGKTIAERQELRRMVQIKSTNATMTMRIVTVAASLFVIIPALFIEQGIVYYRTPLGWATAAGIALALVLANLIARHQRERIV